MRLDIYVHAEKEGTTGSLSRPKGRKAKRTVQFNFRCSQEIKDRADKLAAQMECSLPDLIEHLLNHYEGRNAV